MPRGGPCPHCKKKAMNIKATVEKVTGKESREITNHRDLWAEVMRQGREIASIKTENRIALALLAGIIIKLLFS